VMWYQQCCKLASGQTIYWLRPDEHFAATPRPTFADNRAWITRFAAAKHSSRLITSK